MNTLYPAGDTPPDHRSGRAASARAANLLGALALEVAGQVRQAATEQAGGGGLLPDAIIVIKDQPGRTVHWLGAVLRLSQPGTTHLVQKLVDLGWVERRRGQDARSYALYPTPAGASVAGEILLARRSVLDQLVSRLSDRQRRQLTDLASAMLKDPPPDQRALAHLCRLCERAACVDCPVYDSYRSHRDADDQP